MMRLRISSVTSTIVTGAANASSSAISISVTGCGTVFGVQLAAMRSPSAGWVIGMRSSLCACRIAEMMLRVMMQLVLSLSAALLYSLSRSAVRVSRSAQLVVG